MATEKGQQFINKYKGTDCLKSSWEMMYQKGHINLDEFAECANLTEEEKAEYQKQIDICPTKTTEEKLEELVEQVTMMDELIANLMMEI